MTRRRGMALVIAALVIGGGSAVAVAVGRSAVLPSPAVLASLATLGAPSSPLALSGDRAVGEHRWVHPGGCDAVRSAYRVTDAPVPVGSTLADGLGGSLRVTAPYGPSALFFQDEPAVPRCVYSIERKPTVTATIPGLTATDPFTPVTCQTILGFDAYLVTLGTDEGPWTALIVQPDQQQWTARIVKGLPEQVISMATLPAGSITATRNATSDGNAVRFSGTAAAGPVTIDARCTPSQPVKPGG